MEKLRVLDLFAGIGGFSLGLERTGGFETVAFCEIEEFPRKILKKHWPEVPQYEDVRLLTGDILKRDGISVDVITGGFPCQDISTAGKQAGMGDGTRSGLWSEIIRLVGELRPQFVIVENVANLLSGPSEKRGGWFGRILGDLAECGYDAFWKSISASSVGAPHRRERVWIVAHPQRIGQSFSWEYIHAFGEAKNAYREADRLVSVFRSSAVPFVCRGHDGVPEELDGDLRNGQHSEDRPRETLRPMQFRPIKEKIFDGSVGGQRPFPVATVLRQGLPSEGADKIGRNTQANNDGKGAEAQSVSLSELQRDGSPTYSPFRQEHIEQLSIESDDVVRSVSQSSSCGADRLKGLGNAVVPQIPELLGNAILKSMEIA